jgi:hypothetical protein
MLDPTSSTFLAVYRGPSIAAAKLIAVTADPTIIAEVTRRLLNGSGPDSADPVLSKLNSGRRAALRAIRREAANARPV